MALKVKEAVQNYESSEGMELEEDASEGKKMNLKHVLELKDQIVSLE